MKTSGLLYRQRPAIAATITILLSIFVVGLALWQFRATKSFKNDDMA